MHWRVVPGTFDIMIGRSSADVAAKATLEVKSSEFHDVAVNRDY